MRRLLFILPTKLPYKHQNMGEVPTNQKSLPILYRKKRSCQGEKGNFLWYNEPEREIFSHSLTQSLIGQRFSTRTYNELRRKASVVSIIWSVYQILESGNPILALGSLFVMMRGNRPFYLLIQVVRGKICNLRTRFVRYMQAIDYGFDIQQRGKI